jgi:hypothetical protein
MPTVLVSGPYRFFFYSADCSEPAHVHVERDRAVLKVWLHDLSVARSRHFSAGEVAAILAITRSRRLLLKERWDAHCSSQG